MNILIIGGFLGSGKTTTLMKLARFLADATEPGRENKVIILENEIGEVGIDDAYLRSGGFQVDNLFSGCACCTVSGELVSAAIRLQKEYEPAWLVVETTGVAYPKSMRENLKYAIGLDSRIVILADASRWRRLFVPMNTLLGGQIRDCDAVLVNKTDLVDGETLEGVERDILTLEPRAVIHRISALGDIPDAVWCQVAGMEE